MANRGDVISVDKLWDIFDLEREKAWEGVEAPTVLGNETTLPSHKTALNGFGGENHES